MQQLLVVVHGTLLFVLLSAGMSKLWHPEISPGLRAFGVLPIGRGFLRTLGAVEITLGVGMNLGGQVGSAMLAAAGSLFLLMSIQVGVWVWSGRTGGCGCGVPLPIGELSLTHITIDALLFAVAMILAYCGVHGGYLWTRSGPALGESIALLLLPWIAYATATSFWNLIAVRTQLMDLDRLHFTNFSK